MTMGDHLLGRMYQVRCRRIYIRGLDVAKVGGLETTWWDQTRAGILYGINCTLKICHNMPLKDVLARKGSNDLIQECINSLPNQAVDKPTFYTAMQMQISFLWAWMLIIDKARLIVCRTSIGQKNCIECFSNGFDINDLEGWWPLEGNAHFVWQRCIGWLVMVVIMPPNAKSQKSNRSQTLDSVVWCVPFQIHQLAVANL